MPVPMLPTPSTRPGKTLSILLLSVSCALYACAGLSDPPAPADPDPDRELLQGTPLPPPPSVTEQRIDEPVQPLTQTLPQTQSASVQANAGYIILQPGETLSYISALYSVSERNLINWNGLASAHDVRAGQRLAIRSPDARNTPPARTNHVMAAPTQTNHAAAPAPQAARPEMPDADGMITVRSGQSLSGIAARYNVSQKDLRQWNKLQNDQINIGQKLRVQPPQPHAAASDSIGVPAAERRTAQTPARATPEAPDADGMITVRSGQSLSGIAARYNVSQKDLRQWNKLKDDQIKIGQKLRVQAPVRTHTVKSGENLNAIAARYNVSVHALTQKNKIVNADILPVGKKLIIP